MRGERREVSGTHAPELLRIDGLSITYRRRRTPPLRAVRHLDLTVREGETAAIIGESGSGKSSVGHALCGLVATEAGAIMLDGRDLLQVPIGRRPAAAGRAGMSIVFQNPRLALDPRWPVWRCVAEAAERGASGQQRRRRSLEVLEMVGLGRSVADRRADELSGGQRQRVTIARALAGRPRLVVLDEVVSALDVSVRNEVLGLLDRVRREMKLTYLFISHDMASVAQIATHVAVMYRGWLVEYGPAASVIRNPSHPYTRLLLDAVPRIGAKAGPMVNGGSRRSVDGGDGAGCVFRDRCSRAGAGCDDGVPELTGRGEDHRARCLYPLAQGEGIRWEEGD